MPQPNIVNVKNDNNYSQQPQTTKNECQDNIRIKMKQNHRRASSIDENEQVVGLLSDKKTENRNITHTGHKQPPSRLYNNFVDTNETGYNEVEQQSEYNQGQSESQRKKYLTSAAPKKVLNTSVKNNTRKENVMRNLNFDQNSHMQQPQYYNIN